MRVGILLTGDVPEALRERFGSSYADMMVRMLGPDFACTTYDVARGSWPAAIEDHEAYLVTGSSAGVYDDLPWIAELEAFLRLARGRAKLVGICFGHQIMAQAFGGRVEKSAEGWGLGLHEYRVHAPDAGSLPSIAVAVSHQDQVIDSPPDADVVAGNAFTPNGVLAYGVEALSFQCHPEFEPAFAAALVEQRRRHLPDPSAADLLIASLDRANDREYVAAWIRRFLQESSTLGVD